MKRKFGLIFTFAFFDDTIVYKTQRFCTDLESIKNYAIDWVDMHGVSTVNVCIVKSLKIQYQFSRCIFRERDKRND